MGTAATNSPTRPTYVDSYTLYTDNTPAGVLVYTNVDKTQAQLSIGGVIYNLTEVRSGSGARYANADESVVFWEHQGEATITRPNTQDLKISSLKKATVEILSIAPYRNDCAGVGKMRCMVVNGENFYGSISGFVFSEGTSYTLEVARSEKTNVPADANKYDYTLLKVVSEQPGKADLTSPVLRYSPEGTSWKYDGGTLSFKDGRYSIDFSCNLISGSFETDRTALKFGPAMSTRKGCPEDISKKEYNFSQMIVKMTTFTETKDGATLSGGGSQMLLTK